MRVIHKYLVPVQSAFDLKLPVDAEILHFAAQHEIPYIWVSVPSPVGEEENRRFRLLATGEQFDSRDIVKHLGTIMVRDGSLVFHLFEIITPELVYFVSGHIDLTPEEFEQHYVPKLTEALRQGAKFVVGDAPGCDTMTQQFLRDGPVTVFHMLEMPRNLRSDTYELRGGFTSDQERDAAMTAASNRDIAWVRPGREKSGTAKNLYRRAMLTKRPIDAN
jgi:hypothetical protein